MNLLSRDRDQVMEIKIETASISLLDILYEIEKECFEKEAFSKQQLSYMLTDYNTVSLVARTVSNDDECNDEIAGFVVAQVDAEGSKIFGHILTIDVLPACRRKGIAQRLLQEIETIFSQKGIKEFRLEVRENNLPALNLYRKLGYRQTAKLTRYYGSKHGLYLKKTL